jgi:hypothetical protein
VINPIKEFLQINIDYYPVAFLRITLCLKHRIVRTPARAEAITAFRERRINQWLKNLQYGLLDQPVLDRRNTQFPHAASWLWNFNVAYSLRPIRSRHDFLTNLRPADLEVFRGLLNRQSIDACTTFIGFDAFPRRHHILTRENLLKQVIPP